MSIPSTELLSASLAHGGVDWRAPSRAPHPARDAGFASYDAVCRHDKDAWLALWSEDGWVEDPIGVSPIDPTGLGHHGPQARSDFWDTTIATVDRFVFEIHDSFAAGHECSNVGTIHLTMGSHTIHCEGVFTYRVDEAGLMVCLRAMWEWDRTMATAAPTAAPAR